MLTFPSEREWWLGGRLILVGAFVFWLALAAYLGFWLWRSWARSSWAERGRGLVFLAMLAAFLVIPGVLVSRDVRAWPFDPKQVSFLVVETYRDHERVGSARFEGGPEVVKGLRLLEQSGECYDTRATIPLRRPQTHYRVLIHLQGEPGPSRYLDAYPVTQRDVPCVNPGLPDSLASMGLYRSEKFVHWLESLLYPTLAE